MMDLFVSPKYRNFKAEILEYKQLNIKLYREEILPKAKAYIKSRIAKNQV